MKPDAELGEMSFGDHLDELRSRLIKSILSTFIAFIAVFNWHEPVLAVVAAPYTDVAKELHLNALLNARAPGDSFFASMKVSLVVAMLFSAPIWMWQFWAFVGVGLYEHERKSVYRYVFPMVALFVAGVSFGYFILLPVGLNYLLTFAPAGLIQNWIGVTEYLSLFTTLTLVLGLVFELPIAMAMLAKIGLARASFFREKRRYFILIAFVVGALLTPPDVVTQVLMAAPLCVLFELGIFLAWLSESDRPPIAWATWRKRGIVVLVLAALLIYFQGELVSSYNERRVSQTLMRSTDETNEGLPYFELMKDQALGFDAAILMKIRVGDGEELLLVGDGKKSRLVELSYRDERVNKTSDDGQTARFTVSAATHAVVMKRIVEMKGSEFMPEVITALNRASSDDLPDLEALLAGLVEKRPEGAEALVASDDEDLMARVREAWTAWWEKVGETWIHRHEEQP